MNYFAQLVVIQIIILFGTLAVLPNNDQNITINSVCDENLFKQTDNHHRCFYNVILKDNNQSFFITYPINFQPISRYLQQTNNRNIIDEDIKRICTFNNFPLISRQKYQQNILNEVALQQVQLGDQDITCYDKKCYKQVKGQQGSFYILTKSQQPLILSYFRDESSLITSMDELLCLLFIIVVLFLLDKIIKTKRVEKLQNVPLINRNDLLSLVLMCQIPILFTDYIHTYPDMFMNSLFACISLSLINLSILKSLQAIRQKKGLYDQIEAQNIQSHDPTQSNVTKYIKLCQITSRTVDLLLSMRKIIFISTFLILFQEKLFAMDELEHWKYDQDYISPNYYSILLTFFLIIINAILFVWIPINILEYSESETSFGQKQFQNIVHHNLTLYILWNSAYIMRQLYILYFDYSIKLILFDPYLLMNRATLILALNLDHIFEQQKMTKQDLIEMEMENYPSISRTSTIESSFNVVQDLDRLVPLIEYQ